MDALAPLRTECPDYPLADLARAASAHRKRQFLEGGWREQLAIHGTKQLGALRARLVGEWDTGSCLFKSIIEQTSTMFDEQPIVSPGPLEELLDQGGWWTIARQHQQYVRAMHESLVYVGWDPEVELPTFQLVTPDYVTIDASPYNRTRPVTIWWAQQRAFTNGVGRPESTWFWDRWSIESGELTFSIWSNDRVRDLTSMFPEASRYAEASAGKLKDEKGKPLLPFALFHDRGPAQGLWSPVSRDSEVEFGTVQVGLLWTAAVHGVLRASWSQRVLLNGKVKGGTTETVAGYAVRVLKPDPTAILQVDGDNASIAEWGSPLDIEKSERFARLYENRLSVHFGLSPADVVIESMNPASGASLTVSQAGKRVIAKRDSIHFTRGINQLYELVAAMARANGVACSAAGVRTRYIGVALTIDERVKIVPTLLSEMNAGLLDRPTAYQEVHPGTTLEDAQRDLDAMDLRKVKAADLAGIEMKDNKVQDTALQGPQGLALLQYIEDVAAKKLPRDAAIAAIQRVFQVDEKEATAMLGSAGLDFEPAAPPPPPGFPPRLPGPVGPDAPNAPARASASSGDGGAPTPP